MVELVDKVLKVGEGFLFCAGGGRAIRMKKLGGDT